MGMKKHMNEMETVEMLINMMNAKIATDELETETAVPLMVKGRTIHNYTKDDRATMKKAARERELKLAELRKEAFEKAEHDGEVWFAGNYYKGTEYEYILNEVWKHDSKLWKPFTKAEQHKGLEKSYVAELDSKADDDSAWVDPEHENWVNYLKVKEAAERMAAKEIAEWKETANFYATKANAFRMEVMTLRNLLKANGIEF